MNRNEAREYFKRKNLNYKDITEGDICTLIILLNKHIKKANKDGITSVNTMRLSEKIKSKYDTHGRLKECYIFINSHYFTRRECISFNKDGFIGFSGWADEGNTTPIMNSFIEWCDNLAITKEEVLNDQ